MNREDIKDIIDKSINKQEYKDKLIKKLEELKKYNIDIKYDKNMSIEELENIINNVNF